MDHEVDPGLAGGRFEAGERDVGVPVGVAGADGAVPGRDPEHQAAVAGVQGEGGDGAAGQVVERGGVVELPEQVVAQAGGGDVEREPVVVVLALLSRRCRSGRRGSGRCCCRPTHQRRSPRSGPHRFPAAAPDTRAWQPNRPPAASPDADTPNSKTEPSSPTQNPNANQHSRRRRCCRLPYDGGDTDGDNQNERRHKTTWRPSRTLKPFGGSHHDLPFVAQRLRETDRDPPNASCPQAGSAIPVGLPEAAPKGGPLLCC